MTAAPALCGTRPACAVRLQSFPLEACLQETEGTAVEHGRLELHRENSGCGFISLGCSPPSFAGQRLAFAGPLHPPAWLCSGIRQTASSGVAALGRCSSVASEHATSGPLTHRPQRAHVVVSVVISDPCMPRRRFAKRPGWRPTDVAESGPSTGAGDFLELLGAVA